MRRDLGRPTFDPYRRFPQSAKSDAGAPRGLPSERQDESEYWLQKHDEEELWEIWNEMSRLKSEPNDTDACWNDFLQDQEKPFAFEALVAFFGYRETKMMVRFDLKTGKVISKEAKE